MNNEFKKSKNGQYTVYTLESATGGGTSAGSVASVSMPMGGVRKRGDNLIAQEDNKTVEPAKPRNFVAKNAKMGGAGQHKDKKKAAKQGQEKHKKPFAEAAVAAQARPGAVKKGGTLDLSKKVTPPVAKPVPQAAAAQPVTPPPPAAPADMAKLSATVPAYKAPAQPTTPPPPKLGTLPGSTKPADMAKLSATVPAYTPAAKPVTPPPPPYKPGATTPPPPPSKPVPNAPAPTAPPVPGQAAATPAKPSLGADFDAGLAAQKAGGSPTAMMLAQPSIGGNQQMLDAIASGFGLPKGSTVDDILAADAARTAAKTPVAEDHEIQMASSELQSIAKNAVNLLSLVRKYSENDGLEAWQQSKITKAADYLNSVLQSISGEQTNLENTEDAYMMELAAMVAEKLNPLAPTDVWVQDFQKADPNKYRQFKNKTPAKKAQMAVAAHYAANEPSKKK